MAGRDVDLVKERVEVADLVRSYVTLVPAGKNLKGLCPFHTEKTPSFIVSPERKTWHCFGCGKGGDVIRFVMEYENLEFREALRFLAERAGLSIQSLNPQEEREFGILYNLHDAATAFYQGMLRAAALPQAYLASRKLAPATVDEFQLGFAPGGEALTMHLTKAGFAVEDIARAGLTTKTSSGLYRDKFQNRIIFPITNHVGKVVAFTGRLWGPPPSASVDIPKYLNSPETPIFSKSKILFGLSKTKAEIARSRTAVVVEGQMDFLLAWQSGVRNVVAVSGTGLTPQHLERLRRLADTLVVSFDSDEAGVQALDRALDTLTLYDFHVRALDLGPYKDPGEACEADPAFLSRAVANASPAFARLAAATFARIAPGDIAGRKRAVRSYLAKVERLSSSVEQDAWLRELAIASGVPAVSLLVELATLAAAGARGSPAGSSVAAGGEPPAAREPRRNAIASRLLVLSFTNPDFFATVRQCSALVPEPYRTLIERPASDGAALAEMQASALAGADPAKLREEFDDLLRQLEMEHLAAEQGELRTKLRVAEASGDEAAVAAIAGLFHTCSERLNEFRNAR